MNGMIGVGRPYLQPCTGYSGRRKRAGQNRRTATLKNERAGWGRTPDGRRAGTVPISSYRSRTGFLVSSARPLHRTYFLTPVPIVS
jgi:hypothetical protein